MSVIIGKRFEDSALALLRNHGLRLVRRNVRYRGGEIDLVMREGDGTLVFVEVRARASARFGGALASVTAAKQARLTFAAGRFLAGWRGAPPPCRFDVVAFEGRRSHWVRNAFDTFG